MPWLDTSTMMQREEFVRLALSGNQNISTLCKRFGISRKTGYKWLNRYDPECPQWAADRSRRPRSSPGRVAPDLEAQVLELRRKHPAWGGRKINKRLQVLGLENVPAPSTITAILRRNGMICPEQSRKRQALTRFEHEAPNDLWQMDYKGHFAMARGRCHPLTIVDDHSRFCVCVQACARETQETVRTALVDVFRRYGMPVRMLMDHGACWGRIEAQFTTLERWLIRLGVRTTHGRVRHPQTQGKNERFNRTLKDEALTGYIYQDLADCQRGFDRFRHVYNHERPHEALGLQTPASRYSISRFAYPETLEPIDYETADIVRRVSPSGFVSWHKQRFHVGRAFSGEPVALRATARDGIFSVYYCHQQIAEIDLRDGRCRRGPRPSGPAHGRGQQNQTPIERKG